MGFEITNRPPSSTVILRLLLLLFPQLLPMATAFASFTSIASHSSSCLITRRRVPVRVWDPQVQYTIVKLRCCCCCCFFFFFFFFCFFFFFFFFFVFFFRKLLQLQKYSHGCLGFLLFLTCRISPDDEAGSNNVRNSLLQIHSAHTHTYFTYIQTIMDGGRRRRRWVVRVSVVLDL